jgi:hypothetical protein
MDALSGKLLLQDFEITNLAVLTALCKYREKAQDQEG